MKLLSNASKERGEIMAYDYSKLAGRIIEKCGTRKAFGEKMGFSEATISKKLRGEIPFRQAEISKSIEILELTTDDILEYFFTEKLS
jgi:cro-like repressor